MKKKVLYILGCLLLIVVITIFILSVFKMNNNSDNTYNKSEFTVSNRDLTEEDITIKEKEIDPSIEYISSKEYTVNKDKEIITIIFYSVIEDNNKYLYYNINTTKHAVIYQNKYGLIDEDINKEISDVNLEFYSLTDIENDEDEILLKYNLNKDGIIGFSIVKDDIINNISLSNNNYSKIKISKDEKVDDLTVSEKNDYNVLFDNQMYEITKNRLYILEDNYCTDGSLTMNSYYFKSGVLLDDYNFINPDNIIPKIC